MTYRSEAEEAEARGVDRAERERAGHHSVSRSRAWIDPMVERDRYLEDLAEQIRISEARTVDLRAEYEQVSQCRPEPERERVFDARGIKSAGTDEREEWCEREARVVL